VPKEKEITIVMVDYSLFTPLPQAIEDEEKGDG
jgi:hypothetical protein